MDYYQTLDISPSASLKDIKKAYRRLALQYHPDKNNNSKESTEKFKQISVAYQVLSDPIQRSYYDNTGKADIDFDLLSSVELFKIFFKDYDPKLINIIEKTYGRIREELKGNKTDSLLSVIYNIEKTDIIKDAGELASNYISSYINQYMTASNEEKNTTFEESTNQYTYNINKLPPITEIHLPLEYFFEHSTLKINLFYKQKKNILSLQTFFTNHTISIENKQFTFNLLDKPHPLYTRIQQSNIIMNVDIGIEDYKDGFQFSFNYIYKFIDVPILLSKYYSCIVVFKNYGLPKKNNNKGDLIIEFNIVKDKVRLHKKPIHTNFIYSIPLKNIF